MSAAAGEKLQKVLARAGYGSRRTMEEWIRAGRVSVNGRVATLGDRAGEKDLIRVDGKPLKNPQKRGARRRVIVYHKPPGEVCTRKDPDGRPTIFEHLPRVANGRWVAVGRLDVNTSGLILLTTDGELANRLMHPRSGIEREYAVRVLGAADDSVLAHLREGVELEDGPARFDAVADAGGQGANHWYHVTLREGRNREVRRLWAAVGLTVSRLHRVRYGPITLSRALRVGRWDELDPAHINLLLELVGLPPMKTRRAPPGRRRRVRR
jgi:23S rRNA pseudouridine2605 synthase